MKRVIPLVLLIGVSTMARAQTVQVYGIVDGGITRVTGLAGGAKTSVVSGVMDGSRLGVKGGEDLGGRYRAFFTMESRLELDTGGTSNRPFSGTQVPDRFANATLLGLPTALQPAVNSVASSLGNTLGVNLNDNFWDRQIFVGLATPYGAVLAGKQYTPAYEVAATFDTTGTQSALSSGQVGTIPSIIDIRMTNAVAYRIEDGPLAAAVMLAPGEGNAASGSFRAVNLVYKGSPFAAGIGYNRRNNEQGKKSLSTLIIGASVKAGPGTVVTSFAAVKDDNPSGLSSLASALTAGGVPVPAAQAVQDAYVRSLRQDSRVWHLGYRITVGRHSFYTAYTQLDDRLASHADVRSYGGAYTYALSKRTDMSFIAVHFDNRNLAQAAPGQAGMVGGVTASAGTDSNGITFGIRHRF